MIRLEDQDEAVYVELMDFGRNVRAREAVTLNDDGSYTIFVSARLSIECQRGAIEHALVHINNGDFRKHNVQQIEAEAHGLIIPELQVKEDPRKKRYEAMRRKNALARKRIQKQLARHQKKVEYLMETDDAYRREHTIF